MKTTTLVLCFTLLLAASGKSQDVMTLRNGETMNVKIIQIESTSIKYRKSDNLNGPMFVVPTSEVFKIKYENGSEQVYQVSQETKSVPVKTEVATDQKVKYSGPRVGCTFIGPGTAADYIKDQGKRPFVSQFGWQFETRVFTSTSGISGLVEFVPLVGGLDQGMFLPSGSLLFGVRGAGGFEVAVGPNLSVTGLGMVMAIGTSVHVDDIYFPINLAVVPSVASSTTRYDGTTQTSSKVIERTGVRISLLVGFNTKKGPKN